MFKKRTLAVVAALAAGALALSSCSSDTGGNNNSETAPPSELDTLTVASVAGSAGDTALSLAEDEGIFAEHGFKLKRVTVQNAPAALAAAQAGEVDIAYAPSIPLLNAIAKGLKLKVVMAGDGYADNALDQPDLSKVDDTSLFASTQSGITEVSQLRDKKIAIPARGGQFEVVVASLLRDAGISTDDVEWVVLDYQSAVTQLKQGRVDAATLLTVFSAQAREAQLTYVTSPSVEFFAHGAVGLWSAGDKLASDTKRVQAIQKVLVAANEYANAHVADAKNKSIELTGAKVSADEIIDPYWPLTVKVDDLARVQDKLIDLGFLEKPVDVASLVLPQP